MKECSERCLELKVECPNEECRMWIDYPPDLNCTNITVERHGRMTLREISKRFGLSFVRIKQLQDKALGKLLKNDDITSFFEKS
jgi:hypothetical protein